jgi:tetratricopeptide (TPR) repeat protein
MYGEALANLGQSAQAIRVLEPAARRAHRVRDAHAETDAWRWLSSAQIDDGDAKAGLLSARAAVAALPRPLPSGRQALVDAIQAHLGLANALSSANAHGIVDETRVALALMARLDDWRGSSHWWAARSFLGQGLVREGQVALGLSELRAAYEGTKALLGADHPETEARANYLGGALLDAGEVTESVAAFESALDAVLRRGSDRGWRAVGIENYSLAYALLAARQLIPAMPHFDAAIQLFSAAGDAGAGLAFRAHSARALALLRLGRLEEADRDMTLLARIPAADADKALFQARFALLRSRQGRHAEALTLALAARQGLGAMPSKTRQAALLSMVGMVLLAAARPQEAITALEPAILLYREVQTSSSPDSLEAAAALQAARQAAGRSYH